MLSSDICLMPSMFGHLQPALDGHRCCELAVPLKQTDDSIRLPSSRFRAMTSQPAEIPIRIFSNLVPPSQMTAWRFVEIAVGGLLFTGAAVVKHAGLVLWYEALQVLNAVGPCKSREVKASGIVQGALPFPVQSLRGFPTVLAEPDGQSA